MIMASFPQKVLLQTLSSNKAKKNFSKRRIFEGLQISFKDKIFVENDLQIWWVLPPLMDEILEVLFSGHPYMKEQF